MGDAGAGARSLALSLARAVPLGTFARLAPRDVIGFCYHVVSDEPLPHVRRLYDHKTPAQFEADLRFLQRRFRFVPHAELVEALRAGRSLGPNAALLSFDDGFAECHSVVRPILLRLGIPCTFFLITGALDNRMLVHSNQASLCLERLDSLSPAGERALLERVRREPGMEARDRAGLVRRVKGMVRTGDPEGARRALDRLCEWLEIDVEGYLRTRRPYLSREEARALAADGFTLGGHTRSHAHLGMVPDPARVREEVLGSCREVAELAPSSGPVPFAFPHDTEGVDLAAVEALLRQNPGVGPAFDTGRLVRRSERVIPRLSVDRPEGAPPDGTNLPAYLRRAYLNLAGRALRAATARRGR